MAATPAGPTSRSIHGIRIFVKTQPTSAAIRRYDFEEGRKGPLRVSVKHCVRRGTLTNPPWSSRLLDEARRGVHWVGECVAHRRFAVDRLLALAHLVLGGWALDRDRVAD